MRKYHKIYNVFNRKMSGDHHLIPWDWKTPEFEQLRDIPWEWTEKVNGTNIRIGWGGRRVKFGGRTDKANIPSMIREHLEATYTRDKLSSIFAVEGEEAPEVTLFGEGVGPKIQSGGAYGETRVILFDVNIGGIWLKREALEAIADSLEVDCVPSLGLMTMGEAIHYASSERMSGCAVEPKAAEGIVGTPVPGLLDRMGRRVVVKLKTSDLEPLELSRQSIASACRLRV